MTSMRTWTHPAVQRAGRLTQCQTDKSSLTTAAVLFIGRAAHRENPELKFSPSVCAHDAPVLETTGSDKRRGMSLPRYRDNAFHSDVMPLNLHSKLRTWLLVIWQVGSG